MLYIPNYASALRCVGQALERQNIDIFELITDGDGFVVRCPDPKPPYTAILRLNYSADTITILDREGRPSAGKRNPSFASTAYHKFLGLRADMLTLNGRSYCG